MSTGTATILLWLFVINLGVAFGAGLYEHKIVVPRWITPGDAGAHWNAEAVRRDDTGLRFWGVVTTGPLTLLTLANLFAGWKASGAVRGWWLAAAWLSWWSGSSRSRTSFQRWWILEMPLIHQHRLQSRHDGRA